MVKFCDNCGKEIEDYEMKYHTSPFGKKIAVCDKCFRNYERKSLRKIKKNRKIMKASIVIFIIIILLASISVAGYYVMNQTYYELKQEIGNINVNIEETWNNLNNSNIELNNLESEFERYNTCLQENLSELQLLKSGDEYQLHEPLYSEVVDFIGNDNSEDEILLVENAKKQGLRCAFVIVNIVGSTIVLVGEDPEGGSYSLVAFNTLDKGTVYFEAVTDYRVFPEVGKKYTECVEGAPYWSGYFVDDTITDMLLIW